MERDNKHMDMIKERLKKLKIVKLKDFSYEIEVAKALDELETEGAIETNYIDDNKMQVLINPHMALESLLDIHPFPIPYDLSRAGVAKKDRPMLLALCLIAYKKGIDIEKDKAIPAYDNELVGALESIDQYYDTNKFTKDPMRAVYWVNTNKRLQKEIEKWQKISEEQNP